MTLDPYSGVIRRALIPPDQAEALEKIPGWGPQTFNDDFTPADVAEAAGEELADQPEALVQKKDVSDVEEPDDHIQGTGGFLDFQEPPQFRPTEDDSEAERDVSKADSYNQAFEDGTEDVATLESQPPESINQLRFDDFQPLTQDPGFDSLLPFGPDSTPHGLTQEETDEAGPSGTAALHSATPEKEAHVEGGTLRLEQSPQRTDDRDAEDERELQTGTEASSQANSEEIGEKRTGVVTEGRRDEEDEEEYLDAVAEPASSQETAATRVGRSRGQKRGANGAAAGEPSSKRPATPLPPLSSRSAAISKRVHAAAKAAEAARDSSTRATTSSAFTAATALSNNVAPLSDSSLQPRPLGTATKPGVVGDRAKPLDARQTEKTAPRSADLPGVADRGLSESGGAGHAKQQPVLDAKIPEEVRGAQQALVEDKFVEHVEVAPTPPIATGRRGKQTDGAERDDRGKSGARDSRLHREEDERTGTGAPRSVDTQGGAQEGAAGHAAKEGPIKAQGSNDTARERDRNASGQEAPGSSGEKRRQPAASSSTGLPSGKQSAAGSGPSRLKDTEGSPMETLPELPDELEPDVRTDALARAGSQEDSQPAGEQTGDSMSADEGSGESPKAWEMLQGTVRGDSLKVHWPEMTVGEFRTRQSIPRSFAEAVNFWPRNGPAQQPASSVNLLTIAIDAGLWSPPPFYRGKRPRLGQKK